MSPRSDETTLRPGSSGDPIRTHLSTKRPSTPSPPSVVLTVSDPVPPVSVLRTPVHTVSRTSFRPVAVKDDRLDTLLVA